MTDKDDMAISTSGTTSSRTASTASFTIGQDVVATVRQYILLMNLHDLEALKSFYAEDAFLSFRDKHGQLVHKVSWEAMQPETDILYASFPDLKFSYDCIEEEQHKGDGGDENDQRDGSGPSCPSHSVVYVKNLTCCGTHTGPPFAFGPCPAIPTSNKFVQNDPEDLCFTFAPDGKVAKLEVTARGENTGPAGLYSQLGGFPLLGELPHNLPPGPPSSA